MKEVYIYIYAGAVWHFEGGDFLSGKADPEAERTSGNVTVPYQRRLVMNIIRTRQFWHMIRWLGELDGQGCQLLVADG